MPEMRRKAYVGPGDSLHGARAGADVQSMGPIVMLDPETTALPTAAWYNDALRAVFVVLVCMHANQHVALKRNRRELNTRAGPANDGGQQLHHKWVFHRAKLDAGAV